MTERAQILAATAQAQITELPDLLTTLDEAHATVPGFSLRPNALGRTDVR